MAQAKRASPIMASCDFAGVEKETAPAYAPHETLGHGTREAIGRTPCTNSGAVAFRPRHLNLQFHASLNHDNLCIWFELLSYRGEDVREKHLVER